MRCAVLGSPIGHSLSPTLHRAAYAELGLDWTYDRFEVTEDELAGFVAGLDGRWRGLSVTMPLKVAVLDLGLVDEVAHLAGAGNTLIFDGDVRRVHNTDVGGLVSAVRRVSAAPARRVTILGTGATARSALLSAAQLGAEEVTVVGRTPGESRAAAGAGRPAGTRRTRPGLDVTAARRGSGHLHRRRRCRRRHRAGGRRERAADLRRHLRSVAHRARLGRRARRLHGDQRPRPADRPGPAADRADDRPHRPRRHPLRRPPGPTCPKLSARSSTLRF